MSGCCIFAKLWLGPPLPMYKKASLECRIQELSLFWITSNLVPNSASLIICPNHLTQTQPHNVSFPAPSYGDTPLAPHGMHFPLYQQYTQHVLLPVWLIRSGCRASTERRWEGRGLGIQLGCLSDSLAHGRNSASVC